MNVGLHQGSALSPLLFITVMDVISDEIGRGPPHAMLFADDLVKTHLNKQKSSWNCGERQSRIRDYESAGARQNIYHRLPVMTVKLNLVEKRSRM